MTDEMCIRDSPKKAAYYEKMIQDFFASQSTVKAQMAVGGLEIQSYGMVIHPDGTAHYYVCGDVSPEKKAKIPCTRSRLISSATSNNL